MQQSEALKESLMTHPCFNEDAHKKFARMHLPVAPRCNIQCNYCNRKYDCCNESRPGVTSEVLSPNEAIEKITLVKEKIPALKVIAIAGPGDPLANESTFETIRIVKDRFPEMSLCISTNGLRLPDYVDELYSSGVRFVTITMNGIDPEITKDIYDSVMWNGTCYKGKEAAEILLRNQIEGIELCVKKGMIVKVNVVLIPGINSEHIPDVVKKVKGLGVYIVNILPLIPVEGTKFSNIEAPTPEERKKLLDTCSSDIKMMRHCRQCRADAIGLLDDDRSNEFVRTRPCGSGCGPSVENNPITISDDRAKRVAIASESGIAVDGGFGNTKRFVIYEGHKIVDEIQIDISCNTYGQSHSDHIREIISKLKDCDTVVVKEIGSAPLNILRSEGKRVIISDKDIEKILSELF